MAKDSDLLSRRAMLLNMAQYISSFAIAGVSAVDMGFQMKEIKNLKKKRRCSIPAPVENYLDNPKKTHVIEYKNEPDCITVYENPARNTSLRKGIYRDIALLGGTLVSTIAAEEVAKLRYEADVRLDE